MNSFLRAVFILSAIYYLSSIICLLSAQEGEDYFVENNISPEPAEDAAFEENIPIEPNESTPVSTEEQIVPPPIQATTKIEGDKISLDIKGMDIIDVLKMMAQRSGLNIVVGKNVTGRVTMFLKDVDIWDAFEIILSANDLAYEEKNGIINVITQRDYELQYGERHEDKKKAEIIQLKYAKAVDLSRAITQIKSNVGKIIVDEGSNTLVLLDTPEKLSEMKGFIKTMDLPVQRRVFGLNYAQADKIQAKLQEVSTKGVGSVRIDERTNKIVVSDYPEKIMEIAQIISAFDEKTPQVLIDAQIVEISPQKDQFTMGIDWDYWLKKNVRLVGSLAAPGITDTAAIPNKLSIGVAAAGSSVSSVDDTKAVLDLLRVIGETKILSSPRIMVLNNQEAKILVGTKEAYITSSTSQTGETAVTAQSVNFVDVGIKLYVTPTINRDGFVTMKIKPEISSSVSTNLTSQSQTTQVPIVTTSETETTVMVKDGISIIIAGLKRDKKIKEVRKIPVLGDIPLLGYAFKNNKDEVIKTELVIFLTPHIVSGDEPLAYASLTNDKDILYLQAQSEEKKDNPPREEAAVQKREEVIVDTDKIITVENYRRSVFDKIKSVSALNNEDSNLKGSAELSFIVEADGALSGEPKVISSSNSALDSIAINRVKRAAPFGPFPEGITKDRETFKISLFYE